MHVSSGIVSQEEDYCISVYIAGTYMYIFIFYFFKFFPSELKDLQELYMSPAVQTYI